MYINKIWEVNGSEDERMVYAEIEILRQRYLNSNFKVVEMKDNSILRAIQLEVFLNEKEINKGVCIIMENKKELIGKKIKCKNCGRTFIFTEGEQEFYKEKEFAEPKRCFYCRRARKQNQGE